STSHRATISTLGCDRNCCRSKAPIPPTPMQACLTLSPGTGGCAARAFEACNKKGTLAVAKLPFTINSRRVKVELVFFIKLAKTVSLIFFGKIAKNQYKVNFKKKCHNSHCELLRKSIPLWKFMG